jgi:sugar lactone lactonase YvrE
MKNIAEYYKVYIKNNVVTPPINSVMVSTLAGSTAGYVDGTVSTSKFDHPTGVAIDSSGNVYVADNTTKIRKITSAGIVTTLAGSIRGFANGTGNAAQFNFPAGVAVDSSGNLYVGDSDNNKIRKITPAGVVSTLAGSVSGFADGTGSAAKFDHPLGVAVDSSGNVYVADQNNHKIRKITSAGVVSTLAGSVSGFADGTGSAAKFNSPIGVAVDSSGNVYVGDTLNFKIRKITPAGVVTTIAGSTGGYADGTGSAAKFNRPYGVAVDSSGNVYVADDVFNEKIRKITPAGVVTTLAGSTQGYADGAGSTAKFYHPSYVAVDSSGNLYVTEYNGNRIRKITQ